MKIPKWLKILLCGLFLFFSIAFSQLVRTPSISCYEGKSLSKILQLMPARDKERIEHFFLECLNWEAFGYVLFGDKPMALGGCAKNFLSFESLPLFLHEISPRQMKCKKGFRAWRKYEKLFPMTRFRILYEETPSSILMLLVNRKNFVKIVQQHADDFTTILHREVTGEKLLEEGGHRPFIYEVLAHHDGLLGTLLGYGRENSHLYYQADQIASEIEKLQLQYPWEKEDEELRKNRTCSVGWISSYITGSHLKDIELIHLPGFLAILDHPETIALKEHYLQTREKIIAYYKGKDFLEATLRVLTSETEEF